MATASSVQREALSYALIIDTARAHIIDRGVRDLSLRQVAAELGVTAPALYAHVPDKGALIRGVAEQELGVIVDRSARVKADDPIVRLRKLARVYVDYALEQPRLFEVITTFPPQLSMFEPTGVESAMATNAFTFAIGDLQEAVDAGRFRPDLDAETILLTVWVAAHGLATALLMGFSVSKRERTRLVDSMLDTVTIGLTTAS